MPTTDETDKRRQKEEIQAKFFNAPLAANRYRAASLIGVGAYGIVCAAVNNTTDEKVAVKRIPKCLNTHPMATRILRELKFLRLPSKHENIIQVKDVSLPGELHKLHDTYVAFELMPTDLSRLLRSKTVLKSEHVKCFMFQLLRGINYMHTARVSHRDLKPNNILINSGRELHICDFGLARATFENGPDTLFWTAGSGSGTTPPKSRNFRQLSIWLVPSTTPTHILMRGWRSLRDYATRTTLQGRTHVVKYQRLL